MASFSSIRLRGIAWDHTRGFLPMVATAQRFHEVHPHVEIVWHKRTLQEFADNPLETLAQEFDLLVIDHPFVGQAAQSGVLLPLDEWLSREFLDDQAANSVGASHASYQWNERQWAVAIDGATPAASWRADLLDAVPQEWNEVLALASRGQVAIAALPVDCLMNFFMLCCASGEEPAAREDKLISEDVGVAALQQLRELLALCDPLCFERNPIQTYEAMTTSDKIVYCPFAYTYSNYARYDYADRVLTFGALPMMNKNRLRSTLGGTGLAISSHCAQRETALEYLQYVSSAVCQKGIYFWSGGQPAHRAAWVDESTNAASGNFFRNSLTAMEEAYLRPRYNGYIPFQDKAGDVVHEYLREGGNARETMLALEKLYRQSRND